MKKQAGSPRARLAAKRGEAGQTLLEILLAFSVSILALSAIVLGVTTSLSNTQYTKNQGLANSYAQEGMAVIRQIKDSSWSNFHSMTGNYCLDGNLTLTILASLNCGQNVKGFFSREITIVQDSTDCLGAGPTVTPTVTPAIPASGSKVTVNVYWTDNKCPVGNPYCHKVELITCFSNIDQKPNP